MLLKIIKPIVTGKLMIDDFTIAHITLDVAMVAQTGWRENKVAFLPPHFLPLASAFLWLVWSSAIRAGGPPLSGTPTFAPRLKKTEILDDALTDS